MTAVARSRLYLIFGFMIAAAVLGGFARTFYLRPLFFDPSLSLLLQLHGAAFTAWLVLFITQARLIAAHRVDLHRKLGIAGGVIAVSMVILTAATIVGVIQQEGRQIAGMPGWQFVALSSISITLFAGFVGAALALRRRPDWHKRFMLVATLGIMGPGLGRLLIWIFGAAGRPWANYLLVAALAACLIHDWARHRIVHPAFVIGAVVLVGAMPIKQMLAHSAAWAQFARWVAAA